MVLLKQGQVISMLQFDKQGLVNELLNNLEEEFKWTFEAWKNEVFKYMRYNEFKTQANLDFELEKEKNKIIAYLKANTYVLADSYGTGSLMATDNPGYAAYRSNIGDGKGQWNPLRSSNTIVGRKTGHYTDVFGREHNTSGKKAGYPLEGVTVRAGYKIQPVAPSRALEIAKGRLYGTYLPNAYKLAVQRTNFAKYLKES